MLNAFVLALRQLGDRKLVTTLVQSLAITLAIFVAVGFGLHLLVSGMMTEAGWDDGTIAVLLTVIIEVALFWIAFRAVAIVVIGMFGDRVVQAVEAKHYPNALASARPVPFGQALGMGVRSAGRLLGYNLVATPLYIVLLATGVGLPVAFFAINGWLLGRDLGDMVAVRHLNDAALADWRKRTRWARFVSGLATAGLFTVPVLNLFAPIIGAAAMTHLFHRTRPS